MEKRVFEIWTDRKGAKWKVAEMRTRQIKKAIEELREQIYASVRIGKRVLVPYWIMWTSRFKMEFERRKENESKN